MISTVSLAEVLARLPLREKHAEIKRDAKMLFLYVPLPDDLRRKLEEIGRKVLPEGVKARDVDHITLVYIPKLEKDVDDDKLNQLLEGCRDVGQTTSSIHARVQGWGYFDGAEDDGKPSTALVALIDAPGLEDLHVELKSVCRQHGFEPSKLHTYVPHATFAYLEQGKRVENLPKIDGEFDIDKVMLANEERHAIPLQGYYTPTQKAAEYGGGPFSLPASHKAGMRVPKGGSSCSNCKALGSDGTSCTSPEFIKWNAGSDKLPFPADEYCSDWYNPTEEALQKVAAEKCDRCKEPATVKVLWAEGHAYRPACEAHKEAIAAPYKARDDFSGFKKIGEAAHHTGFGKTWATHAPDAAAIREEPRDQSDYTVGKGETTPKVGSLREEMSKLAGQLPEGYTIQPDIDPVRKPRSNRFNVYHGTQNVAYLVTRPVKEGTGTQLNSLMVKPAHRGKGLASALIRAAIEGHPEDDLWLKASPFGDKPHTAHRLKQMYKRHGFVETSNGKMVLKR